MMTMAAPTAAGDAASDLACVREMREGASERLRGWPTTAEEDEDALAGGGGERLSPRAELCVRYRLAQKRNVLGWARFLDRVESDLVASGGGDGGGGT